MAVDSGRPQRLWRRGAIAVVALAVIVRLVLVLTTPHFVPMTDAVDYDRHAVTIVNDHVYPGSVIAPAGGPTAFRPPAFPLFLAGVYAATGTGSPAERWRAGRIAEALLGALAVWLLMLIAVRLWDARVALTAGAIAAVYPPLLLVGSSLLSESLYVPLLLGAVLAALIARDSPHRLRWAALVGVLVGLIALTRSNGIVVVLPLCAIVWRLRPRRSLVAVAAPATLLAALVLTLVPWTVRNLATLHAFVPVSTQSGYALAGVYNTEARSQQRWRAFWIPAERAASIRPIFADRSLDEPALSGRLRHAAVTYARRHPGYIAEVGLQNTLRLLNLEGTSPELYLAPFEAYPLRLTRLSVYAFWVLALLAVAGAFTAAVRRAPVALWAIPALIAASCVFIEGLTRYRAPADPFLILLAALAVVAAGDRLLASRR